MLCPLCNNILHKNTELNKLRFVCNSCGTEYKATAEDTLIYNTNKQTYSLSKDGRTIYYYPANQKVFRPCESSKKCNEKIVAWENDSELNKIYGCKCGYSWKVFTTGRT
jgi:DNA-directed RNA polymerase subunit M/transcription elongation factor TFIIS